MGNARWSAADFDRFTRSHTAGRTTAQVFTTRSLLEAFDPARFAYRESRDSAANPASTPIVLFSDVTGSMGIVADEMIRHGLGTVMREVDRRRPVTDPHLLVGAIGDANFDRAPIQMTQFEAGTVLADQLKRLWIEGGGGGNSGESYLAAHYAAATKTRTDAMEKRGRKGFLFTMGDEPALPVLTKQQIRRVFGLHAQADLSAAQCLAMAQRGYEVFHIAFTGVGYAQRDFGSVERSWRPLLGERLLTLSDHTKVAELVVSTLQLLAGESLNDVAASWSGGTDLAIVGALGAMAGRGLAKAGPGRDVRRF